MSDEAPKPTTRSRALVVVTCVVLVLGAGVATWLRVVHEANSVRAERSARGDELALGPRLLVAPVTLSSPARELVRLGEARPFVETSLYAKVSGYLRAVHVDRGSVVHAGDVLAEIDVPETGPALQAARADAANRHAIAVRARTLEGPGIVSHQEADVAETSAQLADATARVIGIGRDFRIVRAPFDGVVTARFADPGALVQSATSSQTGALPIVRVSDVAHLRVFVYLDQRDATFVHVGDEAVVRVRERPGTEIHSRVARIAGELDPRTRSELVEVDVDNADGAIAPGGFVDVALHITTPTYAEVPAEAIVVRGTHTMVAPVDASSRIRFVDVVVVDDDGISARVVGDVHPGQRVGLSVTDEVQEGARVRATLRAPEARR